MALFESTPMDEALDNSYSVNDWAEIEIEFETCPFDELVESKSCLFDKDYLDFHAEECPFDEGTTEGDEGAVEVEEEVVFSFNKTKDSDDDSSSDDDSYCDYLSEPPSEAFSSPGTIDTQVRANRDQRFVQPRQPYCNSQELLDPVKVTVITWNTPEHETLPGFLQSTEYHTFDDDCSCLTSVSGDDENSQSDDSMMTLSTTSVNSFGEALDPPALKLLQTIQYSPTNSSNNAEKSGEMNRSKSYESDSDSSRSRSPRRVGRKNRRTKPTRLSFDMSSSSGSCLPAFPPSGPKPIYSSPATYSHNIEFNSVQTTDGFDLNETVGCSGFALPDIWRTKNKGPVSKAIHFWKWMRTEPPCTEKTRSQHPRRSAAHKISTKGSESPPRKIQRETAIFDDLSADENTVDSFGNENYRSCVDLRDDYRGRERCSQPLHNRDSTVPSSKRYSSKQRLSPPASRAISPESRASSCSERSNQNEEKLRKGLKKLLDRPGTSWVEDPYFMIVDLFEDLTT